MLDQRIGLRASGAFAQHFVSGDKILFGKLELKVLFVMVAGYGLRQLGELGEQTRGRLCELKNAWLVQPLDSLNSIAIARMRVEPFGFFQ